MPCFWIENFSRNFYFLVGATVGILLRTLTGVAGLGNHLAWMTSLVSTWPVWFDLG